MPIQVRTPEEILVEILRNVVNENLGDITEGSILRILTEALAKSEYDVYEQIKNLYDAVYIYTAKGEDLDRLAALLGLTRKKGFKARGYVTFYHDELNEDKIIPSGVKVATSDGRRYVVSSDTQVRHFIKHEQHTFKKEIEKYKLNERFAKVVEVLGIVNGTEQNVEFQVEKVENEWIFDPVNLIVLAPTDTTTNWSTNTGSLETEDGKLKLQFQNANNVKLVYSLQDPIAIDHHKQFSFWINVENVENLKDVYVRIKSNDLDYWEGKLDKFSLVNGYNIFEFSNMKIIGIPNPNSIKKIEFEFVFYVNVSNTIQLKQIFNTKTEKYTGNVVLVSGLDDGSNFKVSYFPLSKEVWVESEEIGIKYNVNVGEINKLLTPLSFVKWVKNFKPINNAEDKEDDEKFRERILNQQYIRGKATKAAIESAINQLDFIQTAKVEDLFTVKVENEEHTYDSSQSTYTLFNTGIVDVKKTISVKDEDGNTYNYNEDFTIEFPNKLKWIGNTPANGKKFYVSYEYKQLGFFKLFIVPKRSLSDSDYDELNKKVNEIKAAGIQYVVEEPEYIYIDVNVKVKVSDDNLKDEVKSAIYYKVRDWLNTREIGENVYRSQLIDIIMDAHKAIKYIQLEQPTDDVEVESNKVVKAGNINISFI